MLLEFLLLRRPISHQSKDAAKRQRWKEYVRATAELAWGNRAAVLEPCQLTLVYLCGERAADIDNIIKPIQDALSGLVYFDDELVTDVDSHRRALTDSFDFEQLPSLIQVALDGAQESVYVRVNYAKPLSLYL